MGTLITEYLSLPISITLGLISYGLIAKWYVMPALRRMSRDQALVPLLLFHSFRYIGLGFLLTGVTAVALDPRFANPAAYGDLASALLALVAILALRQSWGFAIPLVWIFNIVGLLDLVNAIVQGIRYTSDADMGGMYIIPALIVPALIVSHLVVFALLLGGERSEAVAATG